MMRFIVVLVGLALAGCAASSAPPPPPPPPPPSVDPLDITSGEGPPVATRHFLAQGQTMASVASPMKGLILLRKDTPKRNERVCKAFIALPTTTTTTEAGVPAKRITPTVWLIKSDQAPSQNADCDTLLDMYDYDAAAVYYAHLERESAKGPLLAALVRDQVAYINLAKASNNDIKALVPAWSKALIANNGETIDLDREVLRRACQATGVEPKNVTAEVLAIVDEPNASFWKLLRGGVTAVAAIVPYGNQIIKAATTTCDKVIQRTVA